MVLEDGKTFSDFEGCKIFDVPAEWDTEKIEEALAEAAREVACAREQRRAPARAAAGAARASWTARDPGLGRGRRGSSPPGVFVGNNEAPGWFGGGSSAYVVHPEAQQAEAVSIFRITPRDE